jgi:hypothetical protein
LPTDRHPGYPPPACSIVEDVLKVGDFKRFVELPAVHEEDRSTVPGAEGLDLLVYCPGLTHERPIALENAI